MASRRHDDADSSRSLPPRRPRGPEPARARRVPARELVRLAGFEPRARPARAVRKRLLRRKPPRRIGEAPVHRVPRHHRDLPESDLPLAVEPQVRHRELPRDRPVVRNRGGFPRARRGRQVPRHARDTRRRVLAHRRGQRVLQQIRHLRRGRGRVPESRQPLLAVVPLPQVAGRVRELVGVSDAAERRGDGGELPPIYQRAARRRREMAPGGRGRLAARRGGRASDAVFARAPQAREEDGPGRGDHRRGLGRPDEQDRLRRGALLLRGRHARQRDELPAPGGRVRLSDGQERRV
ncbi:MAG: hypothetical protein BWY81_00602 [Firmicutes bacterium ADurb.Bin467]|nr:MAG: hypothetical protein BWY81_00602 [Firmicutes bacterium ADurb.Bin467]